MKYNKGGRIEGVWCYNFCDCLIPNIVTTYKIRELFVNNSFFLWCRTERRIIQLIERWLNYLWIFFQIFPITFFLVFFFYFCSLVVLRSLIRIIPNYSWIIPEIFPNHKFFISLNQTRIIWLSLWFHFQHHMFRGCPYTRAVIIETHRSLHNAPACAHYQNFHYEEATINLRSNKSIKKLQVTVCSVILL